MVWIISGLSLLLIIYLILENRNLKKTQDHFVRIVEQHVEEVETMYSHMRGIRHDYRNQLQVLKVHLQQGNLSELSYYLNLLDHELNTVDTIVLTGNVAIDAIINSKLTLAKANGIELNAKAIVPNEIPFSHLDLGILMGNLLSNAYESALKCEDPFIRLYVAPIKGNLYISCTNSAQGKVTSFITSKSGTEHGFGLKRMDEIVNKYEGVISRTSEDGVFNTEISLPLMN